MADQYDGIEARILTLIQGLSRFTTGSHTNRVNRGNFRILDAGEAEAVVLEGGTIGPETQEAYGVYRTFDVLVSIFTRYGTDEAVTHAAFLSLRSDIINLAETYPSLNHLGGVIQTSIQSDGDPDELYDRSGMGPFYRMQILRWSVTQRYAITGGEY